MNNIYQRKSTTTNAFTESESWLGYAVEAAQPVSCEVLEVQLATADKMQKNIINALDHNEISVDIKLIGGITANTHIKNQETIDLLILFLGYKFDTRNFNKPKLTLPEDMILLRDYTKRYLRNKFPEALLDDSQPLALEMSIPSSPCIYCYYFGYQQINEDTVSGNFPVKPDIQLFNFKSFEFGEANPVSLITELENKDKATRGNTKTLIRILKNLKFDAKEPVSLTGHQITSIIYSMDNYSLSKPPGQLLFLLLEVSLFLKRLIENPILRKSLKGADNSLLLESNHEDSFVHGITQLKAELDGMIKKLVLEVDLYSNIYDKISI